MVKPAAVKLKPFTAAALMLLIALSGPARAAGPKVGDAAPPLGVETLLNAPDGASAEWDKLKGKVVVVDFWATWCPPCIESIPHMNELAESLAGEEIAFVSVTNEDADRIGRFLMRQPMRSVVGIVPDRAAQQEAWDVSAIPAIFIVGRDGKLLGRADPTDLTADHLRRALAGEPLGLPAVADEDEQPQPAPPPAPAGADSAEPLVEAWVRPSAGPVPSAGTLLANGRVVSLDRRHFELVAGTPREIVHWALELRPFTSDSPNREYESTYDFDLPDELYDVRVRVPEDGPDAIELAWQTVAFAFGLERERGEHESDVLELRRLPGADEPAVKDFEAGDSPIVHTSDAVLDLNGAPVEWLRMDLTAHTKRLVLNETGIARRITVKVDIPPGGRDAPLGAWNAGLAPYGLQLVEARRVVRFVRISRRLPATRPAD